MPDSPGPRFRPLVLVLLLVAIGLGASLSAIPLVLVKVAVAVVLAAVYAYCGTQLVEPLGIGSAKVRGLLGLVVGAGILWLTWAARLFAFGDFAGPLTLAPGAILDQLVERASSMEISSGLGGGTTAEGPSWLLLGTYIIEALAFTGLIVLGALLAAPDGPADEAGTQTPEG